MRPDVRGRIGMPDRVPAAEVASLMEVTMEVHRVDDSCPKPHNLIASDRVEGTPVRRTDGAKIGTIERLMIDKLSGNVAYVVLSFGGFLGMGQMHAPIPWARLTYDRMLGAYHLDLTEEELSRAPSIA